MCVKHWEIIADNLSKAGWNWGCVSVLDSNGCTIWIADAHRGDGNRYIVCSDEKLTAFLELERAIHEFAIKLVCSYKTSWLSEIARMLVRFAHVARFTVNADHSIHVIGCCASRTRLHYPVCHNTADRMAARH